VEKSIHLRTSFKKQTALWSGKGLLTVEEHLLLSLTSRSMLDPKPQSWDLFCIYTLFLSDLIQFGGFK
jgi:hypothetical protein